MSIADAVNAPSTSLQHSSLLYALMVFSFQKLGCLTDDFLWQLEQVYLHRTNWKQQVLMPIVQSLPNNGQELVNKYPIFLTLFPRCKTLIHVLCRLPEISSGTELFLSTFMSFSSLNSVLTSNFPPYIFPHFPTVF